MGIDIRSKNISYTMSFSGFSLLRKDVARCIDNYYKCNNKFFDFYNHLDDGGTIENKKDQDDFDEQYNKELNILIDTYKIDSQILDFIYLSTSDGTFTYSSVKSLFNIIERYDFINNYGYGIYPVY